MYITRTCLDPPTAPFLWEGGRPASRRARATKGREMDRYIDRQTYVCIHMCMYIYIYIYDMYACMYTCMYVCMYIYIYIHTYVLAIRMHIDVITPTLCVVDLPFNGSDLYTYNIIILLPIQYYNITSQLCIIAILQLLL